MIERIKEIIVHYGLTSATFADKIGVVRASLSHLFSGRNQPSLDFVYKVKNSFPEVSLEWLMYGAGTMLEGGKSSTTPPLPQTQENAFPLTLFDTTTETTVKPEVSKSLVTKKGKTTSSESKNSQEPPAPPEKLQSKGGKKVVKLILLYSDHSFEVYEQ